MGASSSTDSITINSCRTVRCATDASWTTLDSTIPLGPLDHLVTATSPTAVVFVYEHPSSSSDVHIIPIERLERAMAALLDHYPHLSGRLQVDPRDGKVGISSLGAGVHLFSAKCSSRLDDFQDVGHGRIMSFPGAGGALIAPFNQTIEGAYREPMFTIQHTRFACGGVTLGILVLHKICDADGFFQLVRDLGELYRNDGSEINTLSRPPHYRSYLSDLSEDNVTLEEKEAILAVQPPLLRLESVGKAHTWTSTAPSIVPPPLSVARIIRFSSSELAVLKTAATDPAHQEKWVSTFDALAAHLYQHVHRARLRLRQEKEAIAKYGELSPTDFLATVNLRPRLGPECFPPKYFPNGFICVHMPIPPDVLADGPLHKVANILHDLTRNPPGLSTPEEVELTSKWIALQPDKQRIRQGFRYGSGSFIVSQWSKFDMYEGAVFDGPPSLVSPSFGSFVPAFLPDGVAILMPTDDRSETADRGAINVGLAMSEPLWCILDQDEEFRRFRNM